MFFLHGNTSHGFKIYAIKIQSPSHKGHCIIVLYMVHHKTDRSSICYIVCFVSEYLYMKEVIDTFHGMVMHGNVNVYFSITSKTPNMEYF